MTEPRGTLLVELREGTHTDHRRVEKHSLLRPLLASTLSLNQYALAIAAFTGFYEALEPCIKAVCSRIDFPGYRYQPRLPLLIEDLTALPACVVAPCRTVPKYFCGDELVGVFYVLEGATQGGSIIAPRLCHGLALTEIAGARYFNLYRQHGWRTFCTMINRCQQHYDHGIALGAARDTFDQLHSHLDVCLCEYSEQSPH